MKMNFSLKFLGIISISVGNWPLVHPKSESDLFLGKYPIPNKETRDPIDTYSPGRESFETSTPIEPIVLQFSTSDQIAVVNNGKSVEVTLDQKFPKSQVTGGILGNNIYIFQEIKYLWTDNIDGTAGDSVDGNGSALEVVVIFYNKKYETFKKALNYRNGLVKFCFLVDISTTRNEFFETFANVLKQIAVAGNRVTTNLYMVTRWLEGSYIITDPKETYYDAYPGSYIDTTGNIYYSTINIILPILPKLCISKEQFDQTFGSLKNFDKQPLIHKRMQHNIADRPIVQAGGIFINVTN